MATVWEKIYNRIFWKNGEESETTPVSAANMNVMDLALDMMDSRIVQLGLEKADADKIGMTYIKYSENADGTDFTDNPTENSKYMGVCVRNSATAPTSKEDYKWSMIQGKEGPQGPKGDKGDGASSWEELTDKPTTLEGFGITDAYTKGEIDNMMGDVETLLEAL